MKRKGIAIFYTLVVLSVVGIMLAATARQSAGARRVYEVRRNQVQAQWLARSGIEMAAARLLESDSYRGETIEPLPDSRIQIKVEVDRALYTITAEARFGDNPVFIGTSTVTKSFRRVGTEQSVTLWPDNS